MRYEISHRTTYSYRLPVARSFHVLHLTPRAMPAQVVLHHGLIIEPAPVANTEITDFFGNTAVLLRIEDEHTELTVNAKGAVEVLEGAPPDLEATCAWEQVEAFAKKADGSLELDVLQYICPSRQTPLSAAVRKLAQPCFPQGRPVLEGVMDLTRHVFETFKYDPTATDISTPVARVLETKRGVCQDFAHLMIASLRSLRIPARYVSGYLLTKPPPGQPKLRGVDASHAWLSVWAPETGWVDFDPTNGIIPSGEHITVAIGRDYDDVSPISGVLLGGGDQVMTVSVDVEPVVGR
jgi:transglutaminase-like putative cysteine protease